MREIKFLSESTINKMAAGETVERPSSVIKELVENSIDAGATTINITINNGGKNLIVVADNGLGMDKKNLALAVERHATSKIDEDNLTEITFFGFRGEALPSIASISKMIISSRAKNSDEAWSINISAGVKEEIIPSSLPNGTRIEIRDLFFSTPVRLKFLKSDSAEQDQIIKIIKKIALVNFNIDFNLQNENKTLFSTKKFDVKYLNEEDAHRERIIAILGKDFINNSIYINQTESIFSLKAYISLPSFNKATSSDQFFFVNNRPIKDEIIAATIKIAYRDFMPSDRHAAVILFLNLPNEFIDVNAHPAKTKIRFRDNILVRDYLIDTLKKHIQSIGHKTADRSAQTLESFKIYGKTPTNKINYSDDNFLQKNFSEKLYDNFYKPQITNKEIKQEDQIYINNTQKSESYFSDEILLSPKLEEKATYPVENIKLIDDHPLGDAKIQLHKNYIISQTKDSVIILDQHAAHERLIYEKLKSQYLNNKITRQRLLIPEIFEINERFSHLLEYKEELENLGFTIEKFGTNLTLNEIPSILSNLNPKNLLEDLSYIISDISVEHFTFEIIFKILSSVACHNSIRSGREMNKEEMNQLLREMENTPNSGQCNHGRPSYIELKLNDIEKLFERS